MNQNKSVKVNEFFKNKTNRGWDCPICGHSTKLVPDEDTAIMVRKKGTIIPNVFSLSK